MQTWFNVRKAAQVAAYLVRDGDLDIVKLTKLIYLANRLSVERSNYPLFDDDLGSMRLGPVNSITLDLMTGERRDPEWSEFVADRAAHMVGLATPNIPDSAFDQLSRADIAVLDQIKVEFGPVDKWDLCNWTHDHCPEWQDPGKSFIPIEYGDLFKALGRNAELADDILYWREHATALANA